MSPKRRILAKAAAQAPDKDMGKLKILSPDNSIDFALSKDFSLADSVTALSDSEISAKMERKSPFRKQMSNQCYDRLSLNESNTPRTVSLSVQPPSLDVPEFPVLPPFSLYTIEARKKYKKAVDKASELPIRRPSVGITPMDNKVSKLEIIARETEKEGDSNYIDVLNSSYPSGMGPGTANYFVETVMENHPATGTVIQTLSGNFMSSVTRGAQIARVRGYLIGSDNFPWLTEWRRNYDLYLAADQCILRKAKIYLTIDGVLYIGYMLKSQTSQTISRSYPWQLAMLTFNMFITKKIDLNLQVGVSNGLKKLIPKISQTVRVGDKGSQFYEDYLDSIRLYRAAEFLGEEAPESESIRVSASEVGGAKSLQDVVSKVSEQVLHFGDEDSLFPPSTPEGRTADKEISGKTAQYLRDNILSVSSTAGESRGEFDLTKLTPGSFF